MYVTACVVTLPSIFVVATTFLPEAAMAAASAVISMTVGRADAALCLSVSFGLSSEGLCLSCLCFLCWCLDECFLVDAVFKLGGSLNVLIVSTTSL